MQRYHVNNCTSAVNNNVISGVQRGNTSCSDTFSVQPNFSLNSRRSSQVTSYKLRCDKEQLNPRLGPPDFNPQTPNCSEETLNREYIQSGYRETVEGLEEAREISLSHVQAFSKPIIVKCKEAIKKRHRAINESRVQKRKAGQVYGLPLSGALLTKPGIFPEQRPCGEDFRRKWIEGLSQPRKRLRSLADHVPHGYRKRSLFEVLIRNNIPLTRATWFVKVTYLNQVRATSSNSSSTIHDKPQFSRCEQWTKDVIDYLQYLLDEFVTRNNARSSFHMRDRSSLYAGSLQTKLDPLSAVMDCEEPTLYNKWWYVVRIIQWHHVEGLIVPSLIIDWILDQLQEKDLLGVLQLLLPVIYGFIEIVVLSQTYVRTLVRIAIRFIQEPSPGGSDLVDNSRHAYTSSAVVEMLQYLILAVPDTFVALDCFPLPKCVVSHVINDGSFLVKMGEVKDGQLEVASAHKDKNHEVQAESLSFRSVVSSIKKCADTLSGAARANHCGHNVAKALQLLDQALAHGDIGDAYKLLFEESWDGAIAERWIAEVRSCLYTSLNHIGTVTSSVICSILLICEWATCEFRDFRNAIPSGVMFSGSKDFSEILIATRLLKLKMQNMPSMYCLNKKGKGISGTFESPGPLHDVIVCWIDQHEVKNGEGFKHLQLLMRELICSGIFNPQAYVRQLIVSGIMDGNGSTVDLERRKRHCKLLKQLPAPYVCDALQEAQFAEPQTLLEAASIYSNERRMVLHGLFGESKSTSGSKSSTKRQKHHHSSVSGSASPSSIDQRYSRAVLNLSSTDVDTHIKLDEIKASIRVLLQLPHPLSSIDTVLDESRGTTKRSDGIYNQAVVDEETLGCDECRIMKRQKLSEERSSLLQPSPANEEELWWVSKGLKYMESFSVEQPPKPAKQAPRGRQKSVRKTQSLAQLAATHIKGSQGASPSHVCENRISCPHHRTGSDDVTKTMNRIKTSPAGDITSIGKLLKQMKFEEKRTVTAWLMSIIKHAIEDAENNISKVGQYGRPFLAADDRSSTRWKLGEDELSAVLYLMDACNELVSATRFLLWMLPKVPINSGSAIQSRNVLMTPRISENHACEVGEAFVLSSIRRYENIIVAADLVPEILSATMRRSASVLASNCRLSGSPALYYAHHLLRKYSNVASVVQWEKAFKSTCDKRLSSELESGRSEGDLGFPLGVPNGIEDLDDYFLRKITGVRVSRVGLSMKDIVHKLVDEVCQYSKDRQTFVSGTSKSSIIENRDGGYAIAHQVVTALIDCMRQTGGAAQEGDPSLVSSAIAAIVNNVALLIARIPDLPSNSNQLNLPSPSGSLHLARRILRIHITCLCILKEALGERQSRVFEVALATEASSALMHAFTSNLPTETSNHSHKAVLGKAAKITAAVSSLVIGAILRGVASLERMVTLFKLCDGLDLIQFARSMKSNVNGHTRSSGVLKVDNLIEVSLNWFRVLVGNGRTVSDGLIVELIGEPSIVALTRMQCMLPLKLVLPPAYSIFAFVTWRPILDASFGIHEDLNHMYQLSEVTIAEAIKHMPFRQICLRDTRGFYELMSADTLDSEFVSLLESNGSDVHLKAAALVPLRSRLFLDALLDCKISLAVELDDGKRVSGQSELKKQCGENVKKLVGKIVNVLDSLQPARFHWQWVQLRLFLNEQAVNEKMMENDVSLAEAIKSLSPNPDKSTACENEKNFVQIVLTRLLVRPDAAPLFSEVVHLLGKSLEDSMLSQAKWMLRGTEVLYGRKSIRQKILNIASELKELPIKPQHWKPWGWCYSENHTVANKGDKSKSDVGVLEEGEVVDEGTDFNQPGKGSGVLDVEGFIVCQQHVTERALIKLILPCVDQGSGDLRYNFANEMIKQMNNIEQKINAVTRGDGKLAATPVPAIGSPPSKNSNRRTGKSSSPAISRQSTGSSDTVPPSPAALRSSMTLRLQFLLRLLPVICSDREPSGRNMRYALASVVLRLLGSRVVHEDISHFINTAFVSSKRDGETLAETSTVDAILCGETLFDCLLLVLHALLSSYQPSWLKMKSESNSIDRCNDYTVFDREAAEGLQNELDCMELPQKIRWRIQAAMPVVFPSSWSSISCQAPSVSPAALACLQPSCPVIKLSPNNSNRNPVLPGRGATTNLKTKPQALQKQDQLDHEIDQWNLLEDGAGSGHPSPNSAAAIGGTDHANLKAFNLLKGAVRVRRTDLTYIGTVDEDS